MAREINQALQKAAQVSALSQSVMPVILCDENFRLCMYTPSTSAVMPGLILGKDMSALIQPDIIKKLSSIKRGFDSFCIELPYYKNNVSAVIGDYEGTRYYAILFDSSADILADDKEYLQQAKQNIADTVDELLHLRENRAERLPASCQQLLRMCQYAQFCDKNSTLHQFQSRMTTELYPYLSRVVTEFTPHLAAIGATLTISRDTTHVFHCFCPPVGLGAIISTLISAAVCISSDGKVTMECDDAPENFRYARISVVVAHPRQKSIESFDDLAKHLSILRLDLTAIRDIAESYNIKMDCHTDVDGAFYTSLTIPYAQPGKFTLHSPTITLNTSFLSVLIKNLCAVIALERPSIDA